MVTLVINNHSIPVICLGNHFSLILKLPESGLSRQRQTYAMRKEGVTQEKRSVVSRQY